MNIWILKSKNVYIFKIFECFEHMDPFLWNIFKFTKKLKRFNEHLIREMTFDLKNSLVHIFFEWFKHIKRFLKHGEFSWKFCNSNFENIRIYFNYIYSVPMVIFQIFKKQFFSTIHTLLGSFFSYFHPPKT